MIRARDVIFWEDVLGHEKLIPYRLDTGISILPVDSSILPVPVATTYAEQHTAPETLTIAPEKANFPLPPLNQGRHVPSIPKELPIQCARQYIFKEYQPPPPNPNYTVPKPNLEGSVTTEQIAALLHQLETDDREVVSIDEAKLIHNALITFDTAIDDKIDTIVHTPQSPRSTTTPPNSYPEARRSIRWPEWKEAMELQLCKLIAANTWERAILPAGVRAVPCKWVFAFKEGSKASEAVAHGDTLCTARLVARGDLQQRGIDYDQTFAPVVKLVSLRILLTIAAMLDIDLEHWDVVAAFLNEELEETVYMKQPPGFHDGTGCVFRLKKSIYGLHQSAHCFYQYIDKLMADIHWRKLNSEWAIWFLPCGIAFIASHIDDFLVSATATQKTDLYDYLSKHLTITDL